MFELDKLAYQFKNEGRDIIRMTLGKSELPLNPLITGKMNKAILDLEKSNLVFPSGLPELKKKLADFYNTEFNIGISENNIIITPGTSYLMRNLFELFLTENDEVLLPMPYYSLYYFCALISNAKIKYYKIKIDTMTPDIRSFQENFTERTRLVIINSPGNPLGNVLSMNDLQNIDSIVGGKAVIISDEIYNNVNFKYNSLSVLHLKQPASRYIITNGFSKGYRMYARRVGYCIIPDEFITPITVLQEHTLLTVDPVVQFGAIEALECQNDIEELVNIYKKRRDYAFESFTKVKDISPHNSMGGFYITIDCSGYIRNNGFQEGYDLAKDIIKETDVAVVPGADFGIPDSLRLSFTTGKFHEGIDRLVNYFE